MSEGHLTATGGHRSCAGTEFTGPMTEKHPEPSLRQPYLKVFGADVGIFEFELPDHTITIGRSEDADLVIPNQHVSRSHATISRRGEQFILADAGSTGGTTINGRACDEHVLAHGDSIQIANYLLQFRTHDPIAGAKEAAARARTLLRGDYCTLPSTMRLKFRPLLLSASSMFASGDTLKVGQGGLLIPTSSPPGDESCLELHLTITQRACKCFLGEIMGVISESGTQWMCVKLHSVPRDKHDAIVAGAGPGPWMDVLPT